MPKKKPRHARFEPSTRHPTQALDPSTAKRPRAVAYAGANHLTPSWRIASLELAHETLGWHRLDRSTIDKVRSRLANLETMTWSRILVEGKKQNHPIPVAALTPEAQAWLEAQSLDLDEVISLRLSGLERIFGYRQAEVLVLLWWDPAHAVCPAPKKHT